MGNRMCHRLKRQYFRIILTQEQGWFDANNAFERVSFTSNANYLVFRIQLWKDRTPSNSELKDQLVLGFDVTAN